MNADIWILISAVVTASILGSLHCVGMCGPLALWASGAAESERQSIRIPTALYHFGRLITYSLVGLLAGLIGAAVDMGGDVLGYQVAAARVVGGVMIVIGAVKLWSLISSRRVESSKVKPSRIGGLLVKLRPYVFRLPVSGRAFATGLLTTLLPCGWLYLFALFAAGTGHPLKGMILMAAFWVGTVPALVALVAGTKLLSQRFARAIPALAAILLIFAGCFTASGRGFAGMTSFDAGVSGTDTVEQIENADEAKLPCCQNH